MPSSVLVRVVFGVLVLATFGAFVAAQRLKRATPIVDQVYYEHFLAPTCGCKHDRVRIYFKPSKAGRVTATIVDSGGDDVRTLVDDRHLSSRRHSYVWNGRDDSGTLVPDGVYHLRVTLRDQARSVTSPLRLIVDTVPPHTRILAVSPRVILPGAPGALGRARIRYRGPSHPDPPLVRVYRTDLPRPREVTWFLGRRGRRTATWDGTIGGRPAPDGVYAIAVTTYDRAGNGGSAPLVLPPRQAEAGPDTGVSVRYLTVQGTLDPVAAGSVVRFRIGPVARRLRWSLGPVGPGAPLSRGGGKAGQLAVRVPADARTGLYLLRVQAAAHRAGQPVVVQGRRRGSVLVVLPAIAWQGTNQVDDDDDGFANTLVGGQSVLEDRPFAHGLPPSGLVDSLAPLLRFLGREGVSYDITTDLALVRRSSPGFAGRPGVLFAGDETWLTDRLDLALRDYVERGGRVASFGTDAFRRRVSAGPKTLSDPTPPERVNVFGEQTARLRIAKAPMVVNRPDRLGLFRRSDGLVGLFTDFEQSQRLVAGASILSAAGRDPHHPDFVAYRLGSGIVVRFGAPTWASELAGNPELTDVTRRIWSLLSR